uniref:Ig-like domain-containing protein n=1 Tax=Labrus bergylta TaxID=56723 RepID=A0A3Q3LHB7_9LABR
MTEFSTIYKLSLVAVFCLVQACSSSCPVLECWFVHEKGRGGLTSGGNQEKTLLYISTDEHGHPAESQRYTIYLTHLPSDPAGTLCQPPLNRPSGSAKKPQCEINPFLPHPSDLKWVAALTESTLSPLYLQADWFTTSHQDSKQQRTISSIMRAPQEPKMDMKVLSLSVTSTTIDVQARLGEPVQLDCSFWVDPSSPLSGSGFAVEWRYQFRGDGRLVLAYDGKMDALNASLGMYICTVYLPYLVAQVGWSLRLLVRKDFLQMEHRTFPQECDVSCDRLKSAAMYSLAYLLSGFS